MKKPYIPYEYRHQLKDTMQGASYELNLRFLQLLKVAGYFELMKLLADKLTSLK